MRFLVLAVLPLVLCTAREAYACSCAPPQPAKAELARNDMVFRAKVVAIDAAESPGATTTDPGGKIRVRMEVQRVWKGELHERFTLNATSPHVGMCEYPW